jgi:hypothetical protein
VRALVLKDLRVLRPWWWLIVPGHMLFAANGIVTPQTFFGTNVALTWAYTVLLLIIDWTQDADRFVTSLPASRYEIVKARYAGALGAAVAGSVLYALYVRLLLAFATDRLLRRWPGAPGWESAEGLLTFFLTVWLASVVYLPFYFRSGLGKGTRLFLASGAPVVVVGAVLVRRGWLPRTLSGASEVMGASLTMGAALAVAAALGWLSLRLSARFYDRRDL